MIPHGLVWQAMKKETSQTERLEPQVEKPCLKIVRVPMNPSEQSEQILAAIPELEMVESVSPELAHLECQRQTTPFWQKLPQAAPATLDLDGVTRPSVGSRSVAALRAREHLGLKPMLLRALPIQPTDRDSRLWTSFALAGLSALLVLAFISSVGRHATPALSSHVLDASSPRGSAAPQPASMALQQSASRLESVPHTNRAVIAPSSPPAGLRASEPASKPASKPVSKPKPRRTEDDDYVAPDTFVTYYNPRSRSR